MTILRDWTIGNRVALAIVVVATIAAGTELGATHRATPAAERALGEHVSLPILSAPDVTADSVASLVQVVVNVDPFQPSRTRPAVRFRTAAARSDDPSGGAPVGATAVVPAPTMTLQGVAHLPDGNALAVLSVRGGSAQIVRVGQSLDQFRLTRVDSSTATLVGPDTTIILKLPGTSAGIRQ
jgi:hypothetical protein